jgi:hypothetical protein
MTTRRRRASRRRLISHTRLRLLFVATADKIDMRSLLDLGLLGLLGLLPLRLCGLLGGVVVLGPSHREKEGGSCSGACGGGTRGSLHPPPVCPHALSAPLEAILRTFRLVFIHQNHHTHIYWVSCPFRDSCTAIYRGSEGDLLRSLLLHTQACVQITQSDQPRIWA